MIKTIAEQANEQIATLQSQLDGHSSQIATLQSQLDDHSIRIADLEAALAGGGSGSGSGSGGGVGNGYYEDLTQLQGWHAGSSLRSQADIDGHTGQSGGNSNVHALYDLTEDAAKLTLPADTSDWPNESHIWIDCRVNGNPVDGSNSTNCFVVWDHKYDGAVPWNQANCGEMDTWKSEVFRREVSGGGEKRSLELRKRYELSSDPDPCKLDGRGYNPADDPLTPQSNEFTVVHDKWTRLFVFWDWSSGQQLVTVWAADEDRDPIKLYDSLRVDIDDDGFTHWRFQGDTSQPPRTGPELVLFLRNVGAVRNIDATTALDPQHADTLLVKP